MGRGSRYGGCAAILLALVATGGARSAHAATIEDPTSGFSLTVNPDGASVCRLLPHEPPETPGCAGLDVLDMEQKLHALESAPVAVTAIRFEGWGAVLTVTRVPDYKLRSAEQIDDFFDGARSAVARGTDVAGPMHGATPGARHDILKLNGVDVARASTTVAVPSDSPLLATSHMRLYVAASRKGVVGLTFAGPPAHAAALATMADGVVRTIALSNSGVEDFGASQDFIRGRLVGRVLVSLMPVGLAAALVTGAVLSRRKRKRTATQL